MSLDPLSIPIWENKLWDINSSSNYFSLKYVTNYSRVSLDAQWKSIFFEGLEAEEHFKRSKVFRLPCWQQGLILTNKAWNGNFHVPDKGSPHTYLDESTDISGGKPNNFFFVLIRNLTQTTFLRAGSYKMSFHVKDSSIFPLLHYQKIYQAIRIMPFWSFFVLS